MHKSAVVMNDRINGVWSKTKDGDEIGVYAKKGEGIVVCRYPTTQRSFPDVCLVFAEDGRVCIQTGRTVETCSHQDIDSEKVAGILSQMLDGLK